MAQLAGRATVNGVNADATYGASGAVGAVWDADHMQGCVCDKSRSSRRGDASGYDCRIRACAVEPLVACR